MRTSGRVAFWPIATLLLLVCSAAPGWPQAHSAGEQAPKQDPPATAVTPSGHVEAHLEGPWRFQIGDNPQWSEPTFDDSNWSVLTLEKPLTDLGFDSYAGYAWYRMRIQAREMAPSKEPLDLLVTTHAMGQVAVFANGQEVAHTQGMGEAPRMYMSLPLEVTLPAPAADGTITLAIRTWEAPGEQITDGLLERVDIGAHHDMAERSAIAVSHRWDQKVIAGMVLSFLFLCVAALGGILYLAQRHHREYLWLAVLCVSVFLIGISDVLWNLALISYSVHLPLRLWLDRIFEAVTLEFILHFTGEPKARAVRFVQAFLILLPAVYLVGLHGIYQVLAVAAEVLYLSMVIALLFRAWRRGFREAGIMLPPFILAATAASIDAVIGYMAQKHWVGDKLVNYRMHMGPIEVGISTLTYAVFLVSLLAVILYRFVRVIQEEQRSNAEVAAARSVQAMLIPTELPSNKYFLLESAYVPVNGVGGDFFQVLPVEDGSILIVAGDVSGKGLQAAMNASTLVGAFRNELSHEPATILRHLNQVMLGSQRGTPGKDDMVSFATCLCARIYRNGTMEVANAGHLSPYRDGREIELPPGLPLGVIPGMTYEQVTFQLEQGMRVIFLSDGVVEAQNSDGELFGFERTQQVSNESARYIAQTAKRFGQNDDITVISVYLAACDRKSVAEELEPAY